MSVMQKKCTKKAEKAEQETNEQIERAFYRHCMHPKCVLCIYREGRCLARYHADVRAGRIGLQESFRIQKEAK